MGKFPDYSKIIVQPLNSDRFSSSKIKVDILRLDLLHNEISGNKWFKLKYNLEQARKENKNTILTFGGAWSNHIVATAAACDLLGFKSIGIIRGDELKENSSSSLILATRHHMRLCFVARELYRQKEYPDFIDYLNNEYNQPFIIPEGGNNALGIKGCKEILSFCKAEEYTHICCPVGTGATLTGLIESASWNQQLLGFGALKNGGYLKDEIGKQLVDDRKTISWRLITDYHFGGFAKKTPELLDFMKDFYEKNKITLDFVYTAKMMFGIKDLVSKEYFHAGSRILAIHTGGLQGNKSLTG